MNKLYLIIAVALLISCVPEKEYKPILSYANTPEGNFEAFWNGIDQNYVFFNQDSTDWDKIYRFYKPMVNSKTTPEQLFYIFGNMMRPLIDHHKELRADGLGNINVISYGYTQTHRIDTNLIFVSLSYLDNNDRMYLYGSAGNEDQIEMAIGKIKNHNILYWKVDFYGDALVNSTNRAAQIQNFDNYLRTSYQSVNGLILDLRYNGGGDAREFASITSRFISSDYQWGYSQIRLQADRHTMSPMIPETVKANSTSFVNKKVVVLVNRYSFSAPEVTTMALGSLPNVTVIGDTTGGATGPYIPQLDDTDALKEYTFGYYLPNKWYVQLAQKVTYDINKTNYEGRGYPPDIRVVTDKTLLDNNIDNQLEAAISVINSGK
ncbi:MAG: S41 family peptidase [Cytophagales bacterium]|nr:S41 family peptidase [Cytophagales bacterium]